SISFHNASSMIGAAILEFPLLRCPRLPARRESKQPPHGEFELASKVKEKKGQVSVQYELG
ncbi:MAG: hypothetical protein VB138_00960, partial [Burkholderia sp.]